MKNPLTTIGGIVGTMGTGLVGLGTLDMLQQFKSGYEMTQGQIQAVWWMILIGNILSMAGKSIAGAASADSNQVENTVNRRIDEKKVEDAASVVGDPLTRTKL